MYGTATNRQRGSTAMPIGLWHEEKRHYFFGTEFRNRAAISATAAISAVCSVRGFPPVRHCFSKKMVFLTVSP
jgi:hypothetical protein